MDRFLINGGKLLTGTVRISGSKNASLPLMASTLLAPGNYFFENVPDLRDIKTMIRLLQTIGLELNFANHKLNINVPEKYSLVASYDLVRTMRASFYVLGPLVSRNGYAKVSLPGGCAWGPRPVNYHLEGLKKMGVTYEIDQGYVVAKCKKMHGAEITFDVPSVGATGNIMMAAVLAEGDTIIENAAMEPEIQQLALFLTMMGAKIQGIGTKTIRIEGVSDLKPTNISIIPDRIEAGTFLVAAAMTNGRVVLQNVDLTHLTAIINKLNLLDVKIVCSDNSIEIQSEGKNNPINVTTDVYPGFPTDMQAQWISLMTTANGTSTIKDTIYHDRFTHVAELNRLGALIEVEGNTAIVCGVKKLKGATVMSTDLRASASLILAGLIAEGQTEVLRIYHIDRGYENIEEKLNSLGADIQRLSDK